MCCKYLDYKNICQTKIKDWNGQTEKNETRRPRNLKEIQLIVKDNDTKYLQE